MSGGRFVTLSPRRPARYLKFGGMDISRGEVEAFAGCSYASSSPCESAAQGGDAYGGFTSRSLVPASGTTLQAGRVSRSGVPGCSGLEELKSCEGPGIPGQLAGRRSKWVRLPDRVSWVVPKGQPWGGSLGGLHRL